MVRCVDGNDVAAISAAQGHSNLTNHGLVEASFGNGVYLDAGHNLLENHGSIHGGSNGLSLGSSPGFSDVVMNCGTISGGGSGTGGLDINSAIHLVTSSSIIFNSGTI